MNIVETDFLDRAGNLVLFRAAPSVDDAEQIAVSLLESLTGPNDADKPVTAVIHGGPTLELGSDGRARKVTAAQHGMIH